MSAAHVFVADLDSPQLADEDRHHLSRVLRLRPGEPVTASDGRGGVVACRWSPDGLVVDGPVEREPAAAPPLTVAFALPKGDKPEWMVQKLTECGVDRIVVLAAERSVARWDPDKAARNLARLRKVAREAAMQSRRRWLPEVDGVVPFAAFVADHSSSLALAEPAGDRPSLARPVIAVGPEGGWSPAELERAPATVTLGPQVLRAETAAVAAGVLLAALRAGLVT